MAQLWPLLIAAAISLMMVIGVNINGLAAEGPTMVSTCESNEKAIAAAAEAYNTAVGNYPATVSPVTSASFVNPTDSTVSYLPQTPVDPADPAHPAGGDYSYTYTGSTTGSAPKYTVADSGGHAAADLARLSGASSTSTKIDYASNAGFTAH